MLFNPKALQSSLLRQHYVFKAFADIHADFKAYQIPHEIRISSLILKL